MATKQEVASAMAAIEQALKPEPRSIRQRWNDAWRSVFGRVEPSPLAAEVREEATALVGYLLASKPDGYLAARAALESLAMRLGLEVIDSDDWDDGEGHLSFNEPELDETRVRAQRGQIDDCLHHLERSLPEGYGVIAERLASAFRSRP